MRCLLTRDDIDVTTEVVWRDTETPLQAAARCGHATIVQLLMERNDVDINHNSKFGDTALSLAARNGHVAVVRLLLTQDRIQINHADGYPSPLHLAIDRNHIAVVECLLARSDLDVNYFPQRSDGRAGLLIGLTPLDLAIRRGFDTCVKML